MNPLIFLDVDGVLNGHDAHPNGYCGTHPACVEHLNRILREVPDARIVVSSAWRYQILGGHMTFDGFTNLMLTHGLDCLYADHEAGSRKTKIIGHTCADEYVIDRGRQIRHWLNENGGAECYVVIDDGGENPDGTWHDMGIGEAGHPVVWTDGEIGLTDGNADRVIAKLRRNHGDIRP